MSSRLGRIWFSNSTARLAWHGRPRGAEMRQWPYIVHVGDKYKIGRYRGEVLAVTPLAVIYIVTYIYNK